jgi:DNA-3-methyladenine glycosylase II
MQSAKSKAPSSRLTIETKLARADPALGRLIAAVQSRIGPQRITPSRASPFEALVRAVVYQSVSGKAAASIFARLSEAITKPLTPAKVAAMRPQALTRAGLSNSKARTIHELACWFAANRRLAKALPELPDEEIVEHLTTIPGIGVWTVNVLLIFNLGRRNVMPTADLGIRRGVQLIDGLAAVATPQHVQDRSRRWSPYRSIASIYLWQGGKLKLGPNDLGKRTSK